MLQQLLHAFLQWCYFSQDYAFIRDSTYGIPMVQSLHLVGITLLLGTTVALNLRLLDIGLRRLPMTYLAQQLWPWTKAGLYLTAFAGILVFLADPTRYAQSGPFRLKILLLCLALLYHFTVFKRLIRRDPASGSTRQNRAGAAVSLLLWFGTGWAARAIAFFQ
ncbi:MAG: DUF6644 family protein [Chloroflexota bacterium]